MGAWNDDELCRIRDAEELQIAPARANGELRRPTTIWAVCADGGISAAITVGAVLLALALALAVAVALIVRPRTTFAVTVADPDPVTGTMRWS